MGCLERKAKRVLPEPEPFTAIVLAAQRDGQSEPLATEFGVSHKCLIPIAGKPLIVHVVAALVRCPGLVRVRICIEPAAFRSVSSALGHLPRPVDFVAAADNLADSVYASAAGANGRILITTADNVLLTPEAIAAIHAAHHDGVEVAIGMTTRKRVLAVHPDGQRRFYGFADDDYSNCNLYSLASDRVLSAAEAFRSGGRFSRNPARIAAAFGLVNLLLMRLGWVSLERAMERISRRMGLSLRAVVLTDGSQAIDVDNRRTYAIAMQQLEMRIADSGLRNADNADGPAHAPAMV